MLNGILWVLCSEAAWRNGLDVSVLGAFQQWFRSPAHFAVCDSQFLTELPIH